MTGIGGGPVPSLRKTATDGMALAPVLPVRLAAGPLRSLRRMTGWHWALAITLAVYSVILTGMSLDVHHGFGTGAYDLGIFEQGTWLLSRFESPFATLRGVNLFGDHASFILILIAPLYWLFPTTGALLGAQSVAIAAGALPVFLYARHRLGKEGIAFVLAIVYLLHPTISWNNMWEFHPEAFLPLLVGFALYGALMRRWPLYWVFVVLTLLVKEDAAFIIVPLGVWVALRRDRRIGIATISAGVVYAFLAFFVFLRYFSGGHPTLYAHRIPFGGLGGFIETALTDPGEMVGYLLSGQRPWYLLQLTAPFAWIFLRLPAIAAIGSLVILGNLASTQAPQHSIRFHYSLVLVTVLAMGSVHALGAIRRYRSWLVTAVGVTAVLTSYLWSSLPMAREARIYNPPSHPQAVAAREALAFVPHDAVVSADHRLTPHLARRRHVYFRPNPFYTSNYGSIDTPPTGTRLPVSDQVEFVVMSVPTSWRLPEHAEAWEREKTAFELIFSNEYYEVYRRKGAGSD